MAAEKHTKNLLSLCTSKLREIKKKWRTERLPRVSQRMRGVPIASVSPLPKPHIAYLENRERGMQQKIKKSEAHAAGVNRALRGPALSYSVEDQGLECSVIKPARQYTNRRAVV